MTRGQLVWSDVSLSWPYCVILPVTESAKFTTRHPVISNGVLLQEAKLILHLWLNRLKNESRANPIEFDLHTRMCCRDTRMPFKLIPASALEPVATKVSFKLFTQQEGSSCCCCQFRPSAKLLDTAIIFTSLLNIVPIQNADFHLRYCNVHTSKCM